MDYELELPVTYRGTEISLPFRVRQFAYSYRFEVMVEGHEYAFERDDQHEWRVIDQDQTGKIPDRDYINAIITSLDELL